MRGVRSMVRRCCIGKQQVPACPTAPHPSQYEGTHNSGCGVLSLQAYCQRPYTTTGPCLLAAWWCKPTANTTAGPCLPVVFGPPTTWRWA
jgi:hypothetical protein